ncbi:MULTISPECIES: hypothetical protein [unclassified Aureimonas]|uniref:hypothetical protein n=1 Tax=unclassified Aureimonas TaxID=2615206 RepID=UPI000701C539|nr:MULTISPECIES: hypothetical protein [unclassified Aureimonas]KQT53996.1 hypothetical protein ASG62_12285 [Aureimonas sp. Leaf427]KQT71564.1 hypothetical protein ASG54_18875 [Aureimonas sp. Leaf460]
MPTLVRILSILGLAAGAVFAAMAALVVLVQPTTRPVTVEVAIPPRVKVEAPAPAAPPAAETTEIGPFEAQAAPAAVDPNVTGGTLRR